MGIIFDSRDALIVGTPVSTIVSFGALRDWRGHASHDNLIDAPEDLTWTGTDHEATVLNPGPYSDLDNGVHVVSGTDILDNQLDVLVSSHDHEVGFSSWVKLSELASVATETELPFVKLINTVSSAYLEFVFVVQSDGGVTMRARYFTGVSSFTFTHPDAVNIVDWTFIAVHFHHYTSGTDERIFIDPGNDNALGGGTSLNIPAGTYNQFEVCGGSGVGAGNLKGIQFADLMVTRTIIDDTLPTDVIFTTPGSETPFIVPAGITQIVATVWSAGAGSGGGGDAVNSFGGHGGGSGFTKATHAVTPAESLGIWVGGGGGLGLGSNSSGPAICGEGAGGGATSSVWRGTAATGTLLQTTGAGGAGAGGDNTSGAAAGGAGGAGGGNTGVAGSASGNALGGGGGTQVAGGAGGTGGQAGAAGASFQGGDGADGGDGTSPTVGGAANGGSTNGGDGGADDIGGFAGGGAGGAGYFGGGGGSSSVASQDAGGGGGGGSNFIIGTATSTTSGQGSGRTPAGAADPLYTGSVGRGADAEDFFDGFDGANGFDGKTVISYGGTLGTSWRQAIRDYTTHLQFDLGVVDTVFPTRHYRTSESDLGGGQGDRFVHSIAGFQNAALAPGGTLDRNVGVGPLSDATNSYRYQAFCMAVGIIHYAVMSTWNITGFVFFKQQAVPTSDGDWFIRFENDVGEYAQLERDGSDVRLRVVFSDASVYLQTLNTNPLLNGSWHRLVFKFSSTTTGWIVGVDGVNYLPAQPAAVPALSAAMTRARMGNIDVTLALMGYANYQDLEILTTFTSQTTEASIRTYIQARTDAVPTGPDYYCGYLPMQDTETGIA